MVGLFKQRSSSNIVMLFLLAFFIKLPVFISTPKHIDRINDGPVYKWLSIFFNDVYMVIPILISAIVLLIHLANALLISRLTNNNKFMAKPNFLPAMAYMLITSFVKEFNYLSAPLIATTFLLLSFINIYNIYHKIKNSSNIFTSGFLLGLASLIFTPSILLALAIYMCLAILKQFKLNEWFILALGIICPFYFYGSLLYLTDQWDSFFTIYNGLTFGFTVQKISVMFLIAMFLILMPLLVGVFYTQSNANRLLIHVRKGWQLIFLMILLCIVVSLVDMGKGFENWILMLPFIAMFHGYGYKTSVIKLYPVIMFWLSVLLVICTYIFK